MPSVSTYDVFHMKNMEENKWRCAEAYELSRLRREFIEKRISLSEWQSSVKQETDDFHSSDSKEENTILFENVIACLVSEYGELLT